MATGVAPAPGPARGSVRRIVPTRKQAFSELSPVFAAGVVWAAFSLALGLRGETPSGPVPWPREHHYLAQAVFVLPLLALMFLVYVRAASTLARALGASSPSAISRAALARAYGRPLLFCYLVPECVAYALAGIGAVTAVARFAAPLLFVAVVVLTTRVVARSGGLGTGRAALASIGATLAQAVVGGLGLR